MRLARAAVVLGRRPSLPPSSAHLASLPLLADDARMAWTTDHPAITIAARITAGRGAAAPTIRTATTGLASVASELALVDDPAGRRWIAQLAAQLGHESARWSRLVESLNYRTAARLRSTWPARFAALSDADLAPLLGNPSALAARVYGGRLGNVTSADAVTYIGRGLIMLTGRDNYDAAGRALGLPLLAHPRLAAEPIHAGRIAAWFVRERVLPFVSDPTDTTEIRRRINGGLIGLDDVRELFASTTAELARAGLV